MKKDTKKFLKGLRKQVNEVNDLGERYTLNFTTGTYTKEESRPKKSKKKD